MLLTNSVGGGGRAAGIRRVLLLTSWNEALSFVSRASASASCALLTSHSAIMACTWGRGEGHSFGTSVAGLTFGRHGLYPLGAQRHGLHPLGAQRQRQRRSGPLVLMAV